jgi:cold shock CspA family protein
MLDKDQHRELSEQLGLMADAGLVIELPGAKYRAPKQAPRASGPVADDLKSRSRAERVARSRATALSTQSNDRRGVAAPHSSDRRERPKGRELDAQPRTRHEQPRTRHEQPRSNQQQSRSRAEVVGRISVNARGFGFVAPEDAGPDVFIPPPALGNALHGDKVRVRVFPSPKGFDGHVLEVSAPRTTSAGSCSCSRTPRGSSPTTTASKRESWS